jgi:hypothetical protein
MKKSAEFLAGTLEADRRLCEILSKKCIECDVFSIMYIFVLTLPPATAGRLSAQPFRCVPQV